MTALAENRVPKIIGEWRTRLIEDAVLDGDDQQLADCLTQGPEGRVGIDQLKTSVRIHARSWVGLVRFPIHIPTALKGARSGTVGTTGETVIAAVKSAFRYASSEAVGLNFKGLHKIAAPGEIGRV